MIRDATAPGADAAAVSALIARALTLRPAGGTRALLEDLAARLAAARLQIAVVGQFKRGKSSLLNALLGVPVLPTGVVPLTAVPTMLAAGAPALSVTFLDGRREDRPLAGVEEVAAELAQLVTEEGNPENRLGLRRVEARIPVPLLAHGLVLVDTPGIGSTLQHNTEAAVAALPECDLALFVVSPDPPVTAAELAYLCQVRASAARIVVVLNKADTQEADDLAVTLAYLRKVLATQSGLPEGAGIFAVSARQALLACGSGDVSALEASGLPALVRALLSLLERERTTVLSAAIAGKAADLVSLLRLDAGMAARAARLPLAELDQRIAAFDAGIAALASERTAAADRLAGDRARLHTLTQRCADAARRQAWARLEPLLAALPGAAPDMTEARRRLGAEVPAAFAPAIEAATAEVRNALGDALRAHQRRLGGLVDAVRQAAAAAMDVAPPAAVAASAELPQLAAWHTDGRTETLASLSTGWVEPLLPAALRERRRARRIRAEAEALCVRNIESFRWSLHQGLDDTIRRFASALEAEFDAAVASCRAAMTTARAQKTGMAGHARTAAAEDAAAAELAEIEAALRRIRQAPAPAQEAAGRAADPCGIA
jgi:hypothetical protein